MKCPSCGKEIANDSQFCEYCGAKINLIFTTDTMADDLRNISKPGADTNVTYCPNCGKEIASDSTFCEYCGAKVNNGNSQPWWPWLFVPIVIGCLWYVMASKNHSTSYNGEQTVDVTYVDPTEPVNPRIDKTRVENLIGEICRCSSKGGNYNGLRNCFTSTISPFPGGEIRYNTSIGEQMKQYTDRFDEYVISSPYNFEYINSSFPLIVKCDIYVTWTMKNGVRKRAWVHKTFYVTSDYKVSGWEDNEYKRERLQ